MPTQAQIDALKADWRADPCWDIEDTEGFEEHKEELLSYRLRREAAWEEARHEKIVAQAKKWDISEHLELAEYLIRIERRIAKLEDKASQ